LENDEPLVSIVILNYNAGELLINCVKSIFQTDYNHYEVIVVDNLSTDNSHKVCKEMFPKIQLINNEKNYGYCEGNNIGIRNAKGQFLVILNPDVEVESSWLKELLKASNENEEGLFQPKILSLYEKDVIQSTGNMMHLFGFGFSRDKGVTNYEQSVRIEEVGYASGTCLFCSSKIMQKIGLFDPFIFLYHDDLDLGWRAKQLGIKSYYVPSAVVYHAESYSLKWNAKKFFWLERNRRYCLLTHYSKQTYQKLSPYLILIDLLVWMFYFSKGFLFSKIKAEIDILKNKKHIEKMYYELESKKIVSDKALISFLPNEIFVPQNVSSGFFSKPFNSIIALLSRKAKKKLMSQ